MSGHVHALLGAAAAVDALEVIFDATAGIAAAAEEVQRRFDPAAGLKIGKVELRLLGPRP